MDLLLLLRLLTVAVRLVLAASLAVLVLGPGRWLDREGRMAWGALAVLTLVVGIDNAILEILALATRDLSPEAGLERFRLFSWHLTYLLHAVLSAALPAALIGFLATGGSVRRLSVWVLAVVVVLGVVGVATDALTSWDALLRITGAIGFLGIAGYLGFWALLLLGRLRAVDVYLAAFVAVRTFFVLLVPVQEVFFRVAGREAAPELWTVHQLLQFVSGLVQLALVLLLYRTLAEGRAPARVGSPVHP